MKKILAIFIMMAMMTVGTIIMLPTSAEAQQTAYWIKRYKKNGRWYTVRQYKKPSYYSRHRNRINMAVGTGAGALLGGLIGGKKGALIGGAAGLGGSALYTYKLNPKTKKYYRVRRY
jgi:hypothetical protein